MIYNLPDDVSRETFTLLDGIDDTVTGSAIVLDLRSTGNAYKIPIPEPYLTYVKAYADQVNIYDHYVAYVTQETRYVNGQNRTSNVYNVAIGDITYEQYAFRGNVTLNKIYASTNHFEQFSTTRDTQFVLYPGDALVYTDLPSPYPDLGHDTRYSKYILFAIIFIMLMSTIKHLFRR